MNFSPSLRRFCVIWLLAALLLLSYQRSAAAQSVEAPQSSDEARAQELYRTGRVHFDLGEYDLAITDWSEAFRLADRALLLFNLAQAQRMKGNCVEALRLYKKYAERAPGKREQELAELVPMMEKCVADKAAAAPTVDGGESGAKTASEVPNGKSGVTQLEPAETKKEPVQFRRTVVSGSRPMRILGLSAIGAGTISLAIAASRLYAMKSYSDANTALLADPGEWSAEKNSNYLRNEEKATDARRLAIATGIVGGVLVTGGVILYLTGREKSELTPVVSTAGGDKMFGLRFSGSF